jgi:hypothetical protein
MSITLTPDQQTAQEAFGAFLMDPIETVFLLTGYSGTGKTTLVKTLLANMESYMKAIRLVQPSTPDYEIALTATTNKAAESFSQLTDREVVTIHSFLGLRVNTDYRTNVTTLIPRSATPKEGYLLFIDEASYVDRQLLDLIFKLTKKCKVVFMGDPAQLTPVKSQGTPVFDAHFTGAALTQVVRQAEGNPIVDLSTKFRNTVNSGEFFSFIPDGHAVKYMERADFNKAIETEFTRLDWKYQDSKILAWTNKCTVGYNHAVRDHAKGDPNFQVGDYAVCNKFVQAGRQSLKTDQLVLITSISDDTEEYGVPGNHYTLDGNVTVFGPKSIEAKNALIKKARANEQYSVVECADNHWIDLRAAYACTVNKSQGSTFDRVFIDLDDIRRCNSGDTIARMLYVGVSRARHQVFLTGDIC